MRIISGIFKSRRFEPNMQGWKTRPTTDRAKESLFNILANNLDLDGITALDLFAGTGSIGYEFLSHGAAHIDFVEKHRPCIQFIEKTVKELGCESRSATFASEVLNFLKTAPHRQYDVIFADPPYDWAHFAHLPELLLRQQQWLAPDGVLIIEHDIRTNYEKDSNFAEQRQYGETYFSFFN